jgi:hypothetical protein
MLAIPAHNDRLVHDLGRLLPPRNRYQKLRVNARHHPELVDWAELLKAVGPRLTSYFRTKRIPDKYQDIYDGLS